MKYFTNNKYGGMKVVGASDTVSKYMYYILIEGCSYKPNIRVTKYYLRGLVKILNFDAFASSKMSISASIFLFYQCF